MNGDKLNQVEIVLNRLHQDANNDAMKIAQRNENAPFGAIQPKDYEEAYLCITKEQGQTLRELIINHNFQHVIEFGTSFGISTIYLADAVRQTGGTVISTELLENKALQAIKNIKDAGLENYVEIRVGDAMETLKGHSHSIDLLFLDGWKDLYLPLFQLLEPQFQKGTMIYADNMDMEGTKPYGNYILSKGESYLTQAINDGKAFLSVVL